MVNHQLVLTLGETPAVLQNIGLPALPLAITGKVIDKCYFDHGISKGMLERIHSMVSTPKSIYKAHLDQPGYVVITYEIKGTDPVIVVIHPNRQMAGRRDFYNVIASMYQKSGNAEVRWKNDGLLLWESRRK